jgi:hypothetical protein
MRSLCGDHAQEPRNSRNLQYDIASRIPQWEFQFRSPVTMTLSGKPRSNRWKQLKANELHQSGAQVTQHITRQ